MTNINIIDAFNNLKRDIFTYLKVCMPGIIESYDYKLQKASVKIDIKEKFSDGKSLESPIITDVPVVFPSGSGASLTMPVKENDTCLILFCDRDISNWLLGAKNQTTYTNRSHDLTDAIAIVGLNPFTKSSNAENNTDVLLSYSDSKIRLKPNGIIDIESAKELNVKTENSVINCKNLSVNCEKITAVCSGDINLQSNLLEHTGNVKITGDLEITGQTVTGTLKSNGKDIDTHTHQYSKVVDGSNPATSILSQTGQIT